MLDEELALRRSSAYVGFEVDLVDTFWSLSLLLLVTVTFLFGVLLDECASTTCLSDPES